MGDSRPKLNCACGTGTGGNTESCTEWADKLNATILPNCLPLDSIITGDENGNDPAQAACDKLKGDATTYPVPISDTSCAPCVGDGMVAVACVPRTAFGGATLAQCCTGDAPAGADCGKICARSAACDGVLGGYGVQQKSGAAVDDKLKLGADSATAYGMAFSVIDATTTESGESGRTIKEAVCGFHPITGLPIPSCPLMTATRNNSSSTKLTPLQAQSWCDCNPEACNLAMRDFCSGRAEVGNPWFCYNEQGEIAPCKNGASDLTACMCWNPGNKPWGSLKFGDLTSITAFQGSTWPLQCLWSPCRDQSGTVLARRDTDAIRCPSVKDVCMNIIQDVHLENVDANSITLGECVQMASGRSLQAFSPKKWLQDNPWVWISGLAMLGVILVVLLMVAFKGSGPLGRFMRKRALQQAQREQTLHANRVAAELRKSTNSEARALGTAIAEKRATQLKGLRKVQAARAAQLKKETAELMQDAATNLKAAKKLAELQAKADEQRAKDAKLEQWYTLA